MEPEVPALHPDPGGWGGTGRVRAGQVLLRLHARWRGRPDSVPERRRMERPGGNLQRAEDRPGPRARGPGGSRRPPIEICEGEDMATDTRLINGVDFIAFPVKDYEAARQFYGETLGLPFGKQWGGMRAGEFETGTVTIALVQADAFHTDCGQNSTPPELHVEDYDEAKAELESRGVEFVTDTIDSGVCKQAIFQDPDGNALAIHHRYKAG